MNVMSDYLKQKSEEVMTQLMATPGLEVPGAKPGATYGAHGREWPYSLIEIVSPTELVMQQDTVDITTLQYTTRDTIKYASGYVVSDNPNGATITITLRDNARWVEVGQDSEIVSCWRFGRRVYNQSNKPGPKPAND